MNNPRSIRPERLFSDVIIYPSRRYGLQASCASYAPILTRQPLELC